MAFKGLAKILMALRELALNSKSNMDFHHFWQVLAPLDLLKVKTLLRLQLKFSKILMNLFGSKVAKL